jgi:hypothetical protein
MNPTIIKTGNKNMLIDLSSNQLTFLDQRWYSEEGDFFPSVTTYLEAYPKNAQFFEWLKKVGDDADEIRDEAGRRGSVVHSLTERYDLGEEVTILNEQGFIGYKLSEWNMFEKYVEFRKNFQTNILHTELNLVSKKYRMGGTLDRVMTVDGRLLLVDIKTSNMVHPHYWLQTSAYDKMLQEKLGITVDGTAILWLNAKTRTEGRKGAIQGKGWQLLMETDRDAIAKHWKLFQACQELWLAENGDSKPRQISYSITHKH